MCSAGPRSRRASPRATPRSETRQQQKLRPIPDLGFCCRGRVGVDGVLGADECCPQVGLGIGHGRPRRTPRGARRSPGRRGRWLAMTSMAEMVRATTSGAEPVDESVHDRAVVAKRMIFLTRIRWKHRPRVSQLYRSQARLHRACSAEQSPRAVARRFPAVAGSFRRWPVGGWESGGAGTVRSVATRQVPAWRAVGEPAPALTTPGFTDRAPLGSHPRAVSSQMPGGSRELPAVAGGWESRRAGVVRSVATR
jgi:hypothetical protein